MITGFNTNVRHCGRLYHVQTEDSGRDHPHVISHLYHGGSILGSEKTQYADRVDSEDLEGQVRALMEKQHLSMVARLKAGEFDAVIQERLGDTAASDLDDATPFPVAVDDSTPAPPAAEPTRRAPEFPPERDGRSFGEGIVSQKPLDEVILEYLVEKARDRPQKTARRSRTRE